MKILTMGPISKNFINGVISIVYDLILFSKEILLLFCKKKSGWFNVKKKLYTNANLERYFLSHVLPQVKPQLFVKLQFLCLH